MKIENPPFKEVLKECVEAVKRGIGNKSVGRDARNFWIRRASPKIKRQLKKVKWADAKKRVLPTATKMGAVAKVLAGERNVIPLWAAEAAADAVKHDPKCPTGPGQGGFCP